MLATEYILAINAAMMRRTCARRIATEHNFGFSIQSAVEAAKCRLFPHRHAGSHTVVS